MEPPAAPGLTDSVKPRPPGRQTPSASPVRIDLCRRSCRLRQPLREDPGERLCPCPLASALAWPDPRAGWALRLRRGRGSGLGARRGQRSLSHVCQKSQQRVQESRSVPRGLTPSFLCRADGTGVPKPPALRPVTRSALSAHRPGPTVTTFLVHRLLALLLSWHSRLRHREGCVAPSEAAARPAPPVPSTQGM